MAHLKSIHFPWGRGIGTLAFNFDTKHVDFSINWSHELIKFVAMYKQGSQSQVQQRSWYKLTRNGWQLLRREDQFGRWTRNHPGAQGGKYANGISERLELVNDGVRRIPRLERPADIPARAWALRKQFTPYTLIDWCGMQLEVISFPSPEKNSVAVMLREFNEPTTMHEVTLEQYY